MPVILATQEAEIRRIMVQSQPQANSLGAPISKINITFLASVRPCVQIPLLPKIKFHEMA
jgi:hypothetical protein